MTFPIRLFRFGPGLLLPIVLFCGLIFSFIGPGVIHDRWRTEPFILMVVAVLLWHLVLIGTEEEKRYYVIYMLWHFPVFFLVTILSFAIAVWPVWR